MTLVAGILRGFHLRSPKGLVFDEVYYAQDACWFLHHSAATCGIAGETSPMHPPLAKWLTAFGIWAFGYNELGWRVAAAVCGTATVAVLYLLARRLTRSTVGATVAAGLLAVDFLHFVQSRLAMLDVFVTFFSVLAVYFLVLDRDRGGPGARWWRYLAGATAGAAVACKWSGALVLVAMLLLALVWERQQLRRELPSLAVGLVVLPVVAYTATFIGVIHHPLLALPWDGHSWWRVFVNRQEYMVRFHSGLEGTHPYESPPWSWLLDKRPVVYHLERDGSTVREVLALGNPLVWWPCIAAVVVQAVSWARSRSAMHPGAVIVTIAVVGYVPWLVLAHGREFVFLFYALPTVPFLCLAAGACAADIRWHPLGRIALTGAAVAVIASFIFAYPVLANRPLPYDAFRQRILFTDCGTPGRDGSVVRVRAGTRVMTLPKPGPGKPPSGWCWL